MKKKTISFHQNILSFFGKHWMIASLLVVAGTTSFLISTYAAVTTTPASGGTNISANTAIDGASPVYTKLGQITITENVSTDVGSGVAGGTSGTLILTAPTNWEFRPGTGSVSNDGIHPIDIQSLTVTVATGTITVNITENGSPFKIDAFSISGIQVRPISGSLLTSLGNIYRASGASGGTEVIVGITGTSSTTGAGGTNFGTLSMTGATNADLSITKSVNTGLVYSGTTIVYTLQYNNSGTATSGSITDTLPVGFTYQSSSPSGTLSGTSLSFTGLTFNVNSTGTIIITGVGNTSITSGLTMTNSATISGSITDPSTGNNTATATSTGKTSADVYITKSVNTGTIFSGTTVVYTLHYNNLGINSTTGSITDTLPVGFTYQSSSPSGTLSGTTLTFTGLTFNVSSTGTIIITGVGNTSITSGLTMTNTGTIAGTAIDPNSANNTATATSTGATLTLTADLRVTKSASTGIVYSGTTIVYTITYSNSGANNTSGVIITDYLPSYITFVSASAGIYSGGDNTVTLTGITLNNGSSATLIITGIGNSTITSGVSIVNTATITGGAITDPTPSNNTGTATSTGAVTPSSVDLTITKSVNTGYTIVGTTVTYTITYGNNGPDTATGLVIEDNLGAGLSFVSSTPTLVLSGTKYYLTGINLAAGSTGSITVNATISNGLSSGTVVTNTGTISSSVTDSNSSNDSSSASTIVYVPTANLSLTKSVDYTSVVTGQSVTYTLSYSNNGPYTATSVVLDDTFPVGVVFVSSNPSYSTSGGNIYTWNLGNIPSGSGGTIIITGTVDVSLSSGDNIVNTGNIYSSTTDSNTGNNTSTITSIVSAQTSVDLTISKTANTSSVATGDYVVYTIFYNNPTATTATGVVVTDTFPSNITFVSSNPSASSTSGNVYTRTIGNFVGNTSGTIVVTGFVSSALSSGTSVTNTGNISTSTFDSNTSNNTSSTTATYAARSDVSITKSVNKSLVAPNEAMSYTLIYGNNGPDISNITITDTLPSNVTFVNSTPSPSSTSGNVNTWNLSNIAVGTTGSITVNVTVNSGATSGTVLTNNVSIASNNSDGTVGNNTSSVNNTVRLAPTASITYNPSSATNQDVVATLTGFSETGITITNNGGSNQYTFTGNGSFTFQFQNGGGVSGSTTATVNWIDRIAPTASVTYGNDATSGTFAQLTGASESITVTNNGGSTTYYFGTTLNFTFNFQDAAGNTGSANATNGFSGATNVTGGTNLTGLMTTYTGGTSGGVVTAVTNGAIQFTSGSSSITLQPGTTITNADSGSEFPVQQLTLYDNNQTTTGSFVSFGISGFKFLFTRPIKVQIPVTGIPDGNTTQVYVLHFGDTAYGTTGLTTEPNQTCSGGLPTSGVSNLATVNSNVATIYSCQASTFSVSISSSTPAPATPAPTVAVGCNTPGGCFIPQDMCPAGDKSGNPYDGSCSVPKTQNEIQQQKITTAIDKVLNINYCQDNSKLRTDPIVVNSKGDGAFDKAYHFAYGFGLTKYNNESQFRSNANITMSEFKTMLTKFAAIFCTKNSIFTTDSENALPQYKIPLSIVEFMLSQSKLSALNLSSQNKLMLAQLLGLTTPGIMSFPQVSITRHDTIILFYKAFKLFYLSASTK